MVYCKNCQPKVTDSPIPKKKPGRIKTPLLSHTVLEDYTQAPWDEDETEVEAAGAVA